MNASELEARLDTADTIHVIGADIASSSAAALYRITIVGKSGAHPGLRATRGGRAFGVVLRAVFPFRLGGEMRTAFALLAEAYDPGLILLAWEDQYLGKNPRSMAQVVAARARFLFAVELQAEQKRRGSSLHTVAVNTMSWQSKVLGRARGKMRAAIKATSDERAPQIAALCGSALRPAGDAADATCIGLHEIARHFTIDLAAIRGESAEPVLRRRR